MKSPGFDRLKKQTFPNTEWVMVDGTHEVLVAKNPQALLTVAGYLKYVCAKETGQGVYFRGQRTIYGTLNPALYRGIKSQGARDHRERSLSKVLTTVRRSAGIFKTFGVYAHEPLLQHYGIWTTWIDLVDNVWVALWFACNRALPSGKRKEYLHFEERIPDKTEQFAYILLIAADITGRNRRKPGYFFGRDTELVDLRMAAPSIFLRPHAQHGLLFRCRGEETTGRPLDYSKQVYGIIGVELSRALDWLGSGQMVSAHSLFPPPLYDDGYRILSDIDLGRPGSIGNILHVGA
ncbi:MAG: FRG domain-containing protein [Terracidiphilus sp.]|jgi:hypothetical protein|nr:FRG domain-containing protein [Terracidiphilus sp.]